MSPERTTTEELDAVQELIARNLDSAEAFEQAGRAVPDAELQRRFRDVAEIRRRHAIELQGCVTEGGANPEQAGSWCAGVQRWFVGLRARLRGGFRVRRVLERCERDQQLLLDRYEYADRVTAPDDERTQHVLRRQRAHVGHVLDTVRNLRMQRTPS